MLPPPFERPPRVLVPRDFAPPVDRLPVPERAAEPRLLAALPPDFDARVAPDLDPADFDLAARPVLDRDVEDLAARDALPVALAPVEREPVDLAPEEREPVDRLVPDFALLAELPDDPPELPDEPLSSLHLPLITRCAASATASAISDPRRVALVMAVLAALDAASAASSPASRILRRAAGLALIAAAAAARPAASISRLMAAFVILSTVVSFEFDEEPEEDADLLLFAVDLLFFAFAIAGLPLSPRKTLQTRNGSAKTAISAA